MCYCSLISNALKTITLFILIIAVLMLLIFTIVFISLLPRARGDLAPGLNKFYSILFSLFASFHYIFVLVIFQDDIRARRCIPDTAPRMESIMLTKAAITLRLFTRSSTNVKMGQIVSILTANVVPV